MPINVKPQLMFEGVPKELMALLREFLEAGKLTPPVGKIFSLEEVPEALCYLKSGDARGKIVISI